MILRVIGALIFVILSANEAFAAKRNDFNLEPICMNSSGGFEWSIENKTSQSYSFQLVPVDNSGSSASGTSVAAPNGGGTAKNRTTVLTTKPANSKGSEWELRIAGFSYRKSGNSAKTCAPAASKVALCHIPPGNPANAHEIAVGHPAYAAHEAHGDVAGPCPSVNPCSNPDAYGSCAASGVLH